MNSHKDIQKIYLINNNSLMAEWNYEKNNGLKPETLTLGSHKKAWWKCKNGHEWIASIRDRNKGHGCPICANKQILKGYND